MNFLFLRRFFSFWVDAVVWYLLFLLWLELNPFLGTDFDLTSGDIIYIFSFNLFVFLFYFFSIWKFNGISIGNLIFNIRVVNVTNKNISAKQSLLRVLLLTFDLLSCFISNIKLSYKNNYQSFVEKYSNTLVVINNNKKFEVELTPPMKVFKAFLFLFSLSVIISYLFYQIFYLDFKKASKEIRIEFDNMVERNLRDYNFNNIDNNKKIKDCIWGGKFEEDNMPDFVFRLYWSNEFDRKLILRKVNDSFNSCINEFYSPQEILNSQNIL